MMSVPRLCLSRFAATLPLLLLLAPAMAQPSLQIISLPESPPGTGPNETYVEGVSADGRLVAGWWVRDSNPTFNGALRWNSATSAFTTFGGAGTRPKAVSDDGWVVGNGGPTTAFYSSGNWYYDDAQFPLTPRGFAGEVANAVLPGGQVAVGSELATAANRRGAVLQPGLAAVMLPNTPGFAASEATDISSNALWVVGYGNRTGEEVKAFISSYGAGSSMTELANPSGWINARARAVSANGRIVAGEGDPTATTTRVVRWLQINTGPPFPTTLWVPSTVALPDGITRMNVGGMSSDGVRVVGTATGPGTVSVGGGSAYLYTPDLGTIGLSEYLAGYGLLPAGLRLTEANGISDDGRVIVGNAQYPGSATLQPVGFRLVLPQARSIADIAGPGGQRLPDGLHTADDLIVYLALFFAGDLSADLVGLGGVATRDFVLTADDLIAFLGAFFGS